MIKSKRKLNKQSLINDSRRYTVVGNAHGYDTKNVVGNIGHSFPDGTVVARLDDTYDRSDDSYVYTLAQHDPAGLLPIDQWLNVAQVI